MHRSLDIVESDGLGRRRICISRPLVDSIPIKAQRNRRKEHVSHKKFEKILHEFSTLVGIQESVHEILMNLKDIVLRINLYRTHDASVCVKGHDIQLLYH